MKKLFCVIISFSMIISLFLFPSAGETAQAAGPLSNAIGSAISDWVLDETNGYIYAVSNVDKKLLIIRTDNLQVEKSIDFGAAPTDIDLYEGMLYIPIEMEKKIVVYDTGNTNVIDTYETTNYPIRTDIQGDKLFYTSSNHIDTYEQWCSINVYNMTSRTEQKLTDTNNIGDFNRPDIVVNQKNNLLYVGESGISTGSLVAISTVDYKVISSSDSLYFLFFVYPLRKVIYDDTNVYYSGNALNSNNLGVLNGYYSDYRNSKICYVNGEYVFSDTAVYDKDSYLKITDLPFQTSCILMDDQNNEYLFNPSNNTLVKTYLNLTNHSSIDYTTIQNGIQIAQGITDWVHDSSNNYIYAISRRANSLLYIDAGTMELKGVKFVGSAPSDIELYNNQLYVALSGSTKAAITGTTVSSPVAMINLSTIPYRIALDEGKLFYTEGNQWCDLYVYDLANHTDTEIESAFYMPDIVVDRDHHILYVGGLYSGRSNSNTNMMALKTSDYTIISRGTAGDLSYSGNIAFDGTDVYFASYRINGSDMTQQLGRYGGSVLIISDAYVITSRGIYDRDSYNILFTPIWTIDLAAVTSSGSIYYYTDSTTTIYKRSSITPYATTIDITGNNNILLPAVGSTSSIYSASVKDQYGTVLNNVTITWALESPVTGVSIDSTGKVTISGSTLPGWFTIKVMSAGLTMLYTIQMTKDQAPPSGLTSIAPTSALNNDGKIIGVTTAMEYRPSTISSYTAVTGTMITGLEPITYYVRYKAKPGYIASIDKAVEIQPYSSTAGTRNMLSVLVNTANMYLSSEHTYMYESALEAATVAAKAVLANPNATQNQLTTAYSNLEAETNRAYLEDLITIAKAKKQSDYMPDRWQVLQTETADADSKLKNPATPAADIGTADNRLNFILHILPAYDNLIEFVQTCTADQCITKTWASIQAALTEALPLQANPYWQFDAVITSTARLLICAFSYQLDENVTWAKALINLGPDIFKSGTWTDLNSAYSEALIVQAKETVNFNEVAHSYTVLHHISTIADIENLIDFSAKIKELNCSVSDWSSFKTTLNAAVDILNSTLATDSERDNAWSNLLTSLRRIIQNAPLGLTGVAPTTSTNADGKITGTTSLMEYKLSTASEWNSINGASINGLSAGTYSIRYSSAKTRFSDGAAATVVVPSNMPTITFDTNGGSDVPAITQDYNTQITGAPYSEKTGYTLEGWYRDSGLTIKVAFPYTVTASTTLYAKWTINSYTVSFSTDSGSVVTSITQDYNTQINTAPVSTKAGFTLEGWYTESGLTNKVTFPYTITASSTLFAKWTAASGGQSGGGDSNPPSDGGSGGGIIIPGGSGGGGAGGGGGVVLGATSKKFTDVHDDDWFQQAIQYVVDAGLFGGVSDTAFAPNAPMTRSMLVSVLYRLAGKPAVSTASPFTDVVSGMWYTDAIIWAAQNNIASGYANHAFKPNINVTREQLADMLYNYAKYKGYDMTLGSSFNLQKFNDASKITPDLRAAMKWACGAGLINGKTPTTLTPKDNASRAEVAQIFKRFMNDIVK